MKLNMGKYDVFKHGVSTTLLEDFMNCRELARYRCVGLKPKSVGVPLTFGIVGHDVLRQAHVDIAKGKLKTIPTKRKVKRWVELAEEDWRKQNPRANRKTLENLELGLAFSEAVMPIYFDYWHRDLFKMEWEHVEDWFRAEYEIQWGGNLQKVPLIGKMDGVFKLNRGLWLMETKTKARINEGVIIDTLPFTLQIHFYLLAMEILLGKRLKGVLYNVIRRPGLRQGKNESISQFAKRCAKDVEARPEWYFLRFEVIIGQEEIERFESEFETVMRSFLEWARFGNGHFRNTSHCENKYGTCNYLPVCANQDTTNFYQIKRKG